MLLGLHQMQLVMAHRLVQNPEQSEKVVESYFPFTGQWAHSDKEQTESRMAKRAAGRVERDWFASLDGKLGHRVSKGNERHAHRQHVCVLAGSRFSGRGSAAERLQRMGMDCAESGDGARNTSSVGLRFALPATARGTFRPVSPAVKQLDPSSVVLCVSSFRSAQERHAWTVFRGSDSPGFDGAYDEERFVNEQRFYHDVLRHALARGDLPGSDIVQVVFEEDERYFQALDRGEPVRELDGVASEEAAGVVSALVPTMDAKQGVVALLRLFGLGFDSFADRMKGLRELGER
jgi:hypothetical protein